MKHCSLLILSLIVLSSTAFAQDRRESSAVTLRDGRQIIRINIGDEHDDRDLGKRLARLERAVRDLQDQVYQLQSRPQERTVVCAANVFSVGTIVGQGPTVIEAHADFMNKCNQSRGGIFCKEGDLKCEER